MSARRIFPVRITSVQEGRRRFHWQAQRDLVSLLKAHMPLLTPLNGAPGVDDYPWCFALVFRRRYYLGAFLTDSRDDVTCLALVSPLRRQSFLRHAAQRQSLAFWLARILSLRVEEHPRIGESKAVRQWVRALRWSFAPGWVRGCINNAWQFGRISAALLREHCAADYRLGPDAGVDAIPWRGWPECAAEGNYFWIWRQSRHGKYIDAQRIAITQTGRQR
ncbi:hypothetical protein [Cronobacter turicensis]|uniref:hypothetical protein n=1 Tax=Cronobacter turicensis TaxID=413502 RepID=UPI001AA15B8F|nr:hypothetical protein [Cronobacter turicensis]